MAKLEDLTPGAGLRGILPDRLVTVVATKWIGTIAVELTHNDAGGNLGDVLLYRDQEPVIEIVDVRRPWSFDGDGAMFRLGSEAHRIDLAHIFDPLLAVHTSNADPFPFRSRPSIGEMLPRQPLRF